MNDAPDPVLPPPGRARLEADVAACERARAVWDGRAAHGPFVITGHPSGWADAFDAVAAAGGRVLAVQDLLFQHRRPVFRRRAVIPGSVSPFSRARWLVAGRPRKRYFDAAPPALARCLWHVPLRDWQQRARHDPALLSRHGAALAAVHEQLHDAESRRVFASLVRARLEGDAGYFRVSPYPEYGHPVVRGRPGDVVIDAGAYDGDSARRFAWQLRGRGTIVALEPSAANYARLTRRRIPGLLPLAVGAWHRDEVLSFADDGGSSRIVEGGGSTVHVAPIDRLVRELGLPRVDLLKLDVEGAEREALDGAAETLRRLRPKVQVSIYHRADDLFALPLRLFAELPGYRWYVGHHGPWITESDLYGIPEERLGESR